MELFVDGAPATAADLGHQVLSPYGAFTSFRVEDRAVRGLGRHLERLDASAVELFGQGVDETRLREQILQALGTRREAWLRISLFSRAIRMRSVLSQEPPQIMVAVAAAPPPLGPHLTLQPQIHQRDAAHLKHVATFELIRARRKAQQAGFDDALFVDAEGLVSEGSVWNIGFLAGDRVIWPQATILGGVTQALITAGLEGVGLWHQTRPVRRAEMGTFDGAFICNSATPACAVSSIGEHVFVVDRPMIKRLEMAWLKAPLEQIGSARA